MRDDVAMAEVSASSFGLYGRDEQLAVLNRVSASGGSSVMTGEPGTGKSSLLVVASQLAQRSGRRVLTITPTQFDQGLPFAGLAEMVGQVPAGSDTMLPGPQRRALSVALQQADPDGYDIDPLAVSLAVRGLLAQVCQVEPVTLVVDDLQWMDKESKGSLGFALRHLAVPHGRLGVLVGTRPQGWTATSSTVFVSPGTTWSWGRWTKRRWAYCCASGSGRAGPLR
jgi:hypothetical protein